MNLREVKVIYFGGVFFDIFHFCDDVLLNMVIMLFL